MIIESIIDNKFIERTSDDKKKILHKIGTGEYYSSALDIITSTYEYEEIDDIAFHFPDHSPGIRPRF